MLLSYQGCRLCEAPARPAAEVHRLLLPIGLAERQWIPAAPGGAQDQARQQETTGMPLGAPSVAPSHAMRAAVVAW